jgi:hypothetical protein
MRNYVNKNQLGIALYAKRTADYQGRLCFGVTALSWSLEAISAYFSIARKYEHTP